MLTYNFLPAPKGIDMMSSDSTLPKGALRDVVNVNLSASGVASTRDGFAPVLAFSGGHSLWGNRAGTLGLYVRDTTLYGLKADGAGVLTGAMLTLRSAAPMSYFELDGTIYFSNGTDLGRVTGDVAKLIGVPDPMGPLPLSAQTGQGSLPAGKYSAAYALVVDGEESGLSPITSFELSAPGAIRVNPSDTASSIRVYMTQPNGDVLYLAAEYPYGLTSFTVASLSGTRTADNQYLSRMPAGTIVRAFNGRLMTASGKVLTFSEPWRFGLTSQRHNFVQFGSDITFVEPVTGGVYVGAGWAVYFLAGDRPGEFRQRQVSSNYATPGASTQLPRVMLTEKMAEGNDGAVAVWLGVNGYSIGKSTGEVVEAQTEGIGLPQFAVGSTAYYLRDGDKRVITVVDADTRAGDGTAV